MAKPVRSLLERYQLSDEEGKKQVSDRHLERLSRTRSVKWRRLPTYLNMNPTVVEDIDHKPVEEDEKRHKFFKAWKERNGSDATYTTLIVALLKVDRREDAEFVCELLQSKTSESFSLATPQPNSTRTDQPVSIKDLDSVTRTELKMQLECNQYAIQEKYAAFLESLWLAIKAKNITTEQFRLYVHGLNPFISKPDVEQPKLQKELRAAQSIYDIYREVTLECCSFLNIDILQSIMRRYKINIDANPDLKYSQYLEDYLKSHTIEQFIAINPKLEPLLANSEKVVLKFDVTLHSAMSSVQDLKIAIAKVLGVRPYILHLVSIEEGCVVITFLLPAAVAKYLFASGLTSAQEADIRAQSVLWLKCGSYTLDEVLHSSKITPTVPPTASPSHLIPLDLQMYTGKIQEPEVQEIPTSKEEVNIVITGERKTGKTELLRNLFGAHVQKRLEKNEVILNIIDAQSLIKNGEPEKASTCDLLLYCMNVVHPKRLQVNFRTMKWLQEIYSKDIWECCVIVFTFSNMLLQEMTGKTQNQDDIKTKYISELDEYLWEFRRILRKLKVSCAVKTIFAVKRGNPPEGIIGIPTGLKKDDPVLLERQGGWAEEAFIQMLYKCKKQKELTKHRYGKNVPITIAKIIEKDVTASTMSKDGAESEGSTASLSGDRTELEAGVSGASIGSAGGAAGGSPGSSVIAVGVVAGSAGSIGMAVGGPLGMVTGSVAGAVIGAIAAWFKR